MSKTAIGAAIVLGIVFVAGLWFMGNYNSLIASRNQVDKAWSSVETQYQRRLDLIDNVVSSVKGSQGQEREVFGKIAEARSAYKNAGTDNEKAAAASTLETNIALIPRLQEAYPELKSNDQVTRLINELQGTEGGILKARDNYNTVANNYNTQIERFPKNMFARSFGFGPRTLFKADAAAATAPKVTF